MEVNKCQKSPTFSAQMKPYDAAKICKHLGEGGLKVVTKAFEKLRTGFDDTYEFALNTKKTPLGIVKLQVMVTKTLGILPMETTPQNVSTSFTLHRGASDQNYRIHCANIINKAKTALEEGKAKKIIENFNTLKTLQEIRLEAQNLRKLKNELHSQNQWTAPPRKKELSSLNLNLNI